MPVDDDLFSIRDIIDSQLETSDKHSIGRVSDIEGEWQDDGTLIITHLAVGPQALARRISYQSANRDRIKKGALGSSERSRGWQELLEQPLIYQLKR